MLENFKFKWWYAIPSSLFIVTVLLILYRSIFLTFVDNYEFPYKYNTKTGEILAVPKTGYVFAIPFYEIVHTIERRPFQICISNSSRVLNCKLVQFNPDGYKLFLQWHGRKTYSSYDLGDIFKAYAFDDAPNLKELYPFMDIQKELKSSTNKQDAKFNQDSTRTK
jgi:hypothetical protein